MNMISVHGIISIMFFNKTCRSTFRTVYVQCDIGKYLPLLNASTKDTQTNIFIHKSLNGIFVGCWEKTIFHFSFNILEIYIINTGLSPLIWVFSNVESNKRSHSTKK